SLLLAAGIGADAGWPARHHGAVEHHGLEDDLVGVKGGRRARADAARRRAARSDAPRPAHLRAYPRLLRGPLGRAAVRRPAVSRRDRPARQGLNEDSTGTQWRMS